MSDAHFDPSTPGADGVDDGLTAEQADEMYAHEAEFADEEPF